MGDPAWATLQVRLGALRSSRGRPASSDRLLFEVVSWMPPTGPLRRDLRSRHSSWQRTYKRSSRWTSIGPWVKVYRGTRNAEQIEIAFILIDSTVIRVHQHGAPKRTERQIQSVGVVRGRMMTKVHRLACQRCDGKLPAARCVLSSAQPKYRLRSRHARNSHRKRSARGWRNVRFWGEM